MAADSEQTDALLRAILETAPALIFAKDLQGRMLIANKPVIDLIGKPWTDVEGRTDREFLASAEQGEAVMENDRRILKRGVSEVLEEEVTTRGRDPRMFLSTKSPMRDAAGQIIGLLGISVDITARKCAEKSLRQINQTLETRVAERTRERDRLWRLSQDLFLVAKMDSCIEAANPSWGQLLGWDQTLLVGKYLVDFVHPDDRTAMKEEAGKLAIGMTIQRFVNRYRHFDGSYRWISWAAVPDDGRIYATGRDITAEREQQAALAEAETHLRQAQKMDAIGQLTGGIAHDFNNMLQGIGGSLELMERRLARGKPEEAGRFVDEAQRAVARAASLTNRLLAFARRQTLAPQPVKAGDLIDRVAELLRRTVGPQIVVALEKYESHWLIHCDPNELESALLNLAINARDAMPGGGELTIGASEANLSAEAVAGHNVSPGAYVKIAVSDTGTGMGPDVLVRAFEPSFTTKPLGRGTGLGLSQLYGFVRQSGGFAKLESLLGEGTTVTLYLPRHAEARPHVVEATSVPPIMVAATNVLVVEDEPAVRAMIVEALGDIGCQVVEAADGITGLGLLESERHLDLLVTDVGLPGLNGRQLADAARQKRCGLPVILLTGYVGAALEDWNLEPGMEVIRKPFALDILVDRVAHILSGHPVATR